jgi:cytochrome P450
MAIDHIATADLLGEHLTADPFAFYEDLRKLDGPVYNERHNAWLIAGYDDVGAAYPDPRLSSDRVRPLLAVLGDEQRKRVGPMLEILARWMVVTDPPAHTRLRKLANTAFKQQRVAAMGEWIGGLVDDMLDQMIASGGQDFVAGLAYPLPATVITKLMGAPAEDAVKFQHWSDELALVAFGGGGNRGDRHERALRGVTEMQSYLAELIAKAKAAPGSDMVSVLIASESVDGDHLSEDELIALCTLILFAGHETTTNLLCNAVVTLTSHPEQFERLRANPDLTNGAVEEILRFQGPIKTVQRWVTEDHIRDGHQLRAGETVFLMNASANRDERVFARGGEFDIARPSQPLHIAFGRAAHSCLGAQLARLEARIALPKIIERLPQLAVAEPVRFKPSIASRAVEGLRVNYETR